MQKTDYRNQKPYRQKQNHQKNENDQKTKMRRKITVFQATNKWNLTPENLVMATKWKPKERNWISSDNRSKHHHEDYVKIRINKGWKNRYRLSSDRDEKNNRIINEFSNLAQKEYKIRHDWVGKVVHWELCKKV